MSPHDNWREITPSSFAWEREALEFVRGQFPRHPPYAAWANFEFFDGADRLHEVDLLLCTPKGLFLVEIKSWPGRIEGDDHTLLWTNPEGRTVSRDHPLRLANAKARSLKSLLSRTISGCQRELPFLDAAVFLSDPQVEVRLDEAGRKKVFGRPDPDHRRPGISDLVPALIEVSSEDHKAFQRSRARRRVDRPTGEAVVGAMAQANIKPSNRMRTVGQFRLERLMTEGPGYQDFEGRHEALHGRRRRIRIYSAPQSADDPKRQRLRRAARRESELLEGLDHPGLLPIEEYVEHDLGPALVLGIPPECPTLDAWIASHGSRLTLIDRLQLLREIVDAVRYAHSHGLIHRGMSPRSIFVPESGAPRIGDWHTGARTDAGSIAPTLAGTRDVGELAPEGAQAYLAPEARLNEEPDRASDVFSLGALAYLLVTGRPPAERAEDLLLLVREHGGLDLAAAIDGVSPALRELVRSATHPAVPERLADAEEMLLFLEDALAEATKDLARADQADPLLAEHGERVADHLTVVKSLGTGSTAKALLVEDELAGQRRVLKVALDSERAVALHDEGEVLRAVSHPAIVTLFDELELGGRTGLLLQHASEGTVARRLREEGPFGLELLARLGSDLLEALRQCEREGFLHRDVKPDNLGLVPLGRNDEVHLLLFDFSLSRADPAATRAGTPAYLDPLLGTGARTRFDAAADRWATAVTLHEMATGRRPTAADDRSNPAATGDEVKPALEIVDPGVRPRLIDFFTRALRSDAKERFDTAEDMLVVWRQVFSAVDKPAIPTSDRTPVDLEALLEAARLTSPLAAIGLSTQQVAVLERHNIVTVEDLVLLKSNELNRLRGVGNRMRRDLARITGRLRRSLADEIARSSRVTATATSTSHSEPEAPDVQGLDALVAQLVPERAPDRQQLLYQRVLLSLPERDGEAPAPVGPWPAASEVAERATCPLSDIRLAREAGIRRWAKLPAITRLRATVASELTTFGGAATADELAARVLAMRGAVVGDDELRAAYARAATRAAIEVELDRGDDARWTQRRREMRLLVAATSLDGDAQVMLDRAVALGEAADAIVAEEPLLPPGEVVVRLQEVDRDFQLEPLLPGRLLSLAAAASVSAAASPRGELYPRGLPAQRAVQLAQGVLLGAAELTADEVRERISARYPAAQPLPRRPEALDDLLAAAGVDLHWRTDPSRPGGGVFRPADLPLGVTGLMGSTTGTTTSSIGPGLLDAAALEADEFEGMLRTVQRDGGPFVLLASPNAVGRVRERLLEAFTLESIDVERFVLDALRRLASEEGIDWTLLATTDTAGPSSPNWRNLLNVFAAVHEQLVERVLQVNGTALLHSAGVLARYGGLGVFTALRERAVDVPLHGWWLLVAQDAQAGRPLLDGQSIEVRGDYEWTRVPSAWVRHRTKESDVA